MNERKTVFLLILIMVSTSLVIAGSSIAILYHAGFEEDRMRLEETAKSQARLIEAIARFDDIYSKDYPEGTFAATLSQIIDAHKKYPGFGKTGEFTLSKKEGGNMVFLLSHRHFDLDKPRPVPFNSELAQPMRLALSGRSGTMVGLDYRGKTVLAAYEPVKELNLGIVAKIDLSEIHEPFVKAGAAAVFIMLLAICIGVSLFIRITNPMIKKLEVRSAKLEKLNNLFNQEIKERKQAVDALSKAHDELEAKVKKRTNELLKANEQLKKEMEERKKAETILQEKQVQLIHAGRLASLGEMATGMAHELNQPLSIIRLQAESLKLLLIKTGCLQPEFDDMLKSVIRAVDRAAEIIEHMRGFARANGGDQNEINLTEPVNSSLSFFKEQFRHHGILVTTEYEDDLPEVTADSQQFEQIMVNFLSNARYAVDKQGEQEKKDYQKQIILRLFYDKSENAIILEIKDNGIGMTQEEKEQCVDPFFTTKEVNEGTGLGLSIVYGIIREFNGNLKITSEKGVGTIMQVIIPGKQRK
ncbi:ATP-binding protein [Desulfobacterales bacterium HSG17]|nr:ATP-binding protein [Desulfobacterales bacterium HSG17]